MKKRIIYDRKTPTSSRYIEEALKRANERVSAKQEKLTDNKMNRLKCSNDWDSSISLKPQLFDPNIKKIEIFKPRRLNSNNVYPKSQESKIDDTIENNYDSYDFKALNRTSNTIRGDEVK